MATPAAAMGANDEMDRTASPADREVDAAADEADEAALPVDDAALDTADTPEVPACPCQYMRP